MSKKYIALIPMLFLLAACSPEAEENNEIPTEETSSAEVETKESVQISEWQVAYSDETWNGSTITIEDGGLLLERKLPDNSLTVSATYNLEEDEAGFLKAENVSKYKFFVPYGENGELLSEQAALFQNESFESEEREDGILFSTENVDSLEESAYLAPDALHIYEREDDRIEIVAIDDAPAILLGVSPEEELEADYSLSVSYEALHQALSEISTPGIANARGHLDEILALTPDSQVAAYHSDLLNRAEQYIQAFNNADGPNMQAEIEGLNTVAYSNLYGVYDTYFSFQENLAPYMEAVNSVDDQLELASGYLDNGQIEDAERVLVNLSGITEIVQSYYPAKAENLASVQTRLLEAQEVQEPQGAEAQGQATFEDFLGYWGNVESPYAPISPGQEMLYISHNYYSSFVMNSDVGLSGQIQGSSIDGNTLYLDVFSKGFEPDMMYPEGMPDIHQTVALTLHEEAGDQFIVVDVDGFMILYYPVDSNEAINYLGGTGIEENLNKIYQ